MIKPDKNDTNRVCGRLGLLSFIMICFIGTLGSSLVMGVAYLLFHFISYTFSPFFAFLAQPSILSWKLSGLYLLGAVINTLLGGLIVGLLGYPLYLFLAKTRGGLIHTFLDSNKQVAEYDLIGFRRHLRRSLIIIPIMIALFVCITFITSHYGTKTYESSTTVILSQKSTTTPVAGITPEDHIDKQQRILMSNYITTKAKQKLESYASTLEIMLKNINVSRIGRSTILKISVESTEPDLSAALANSMAEVFIEFKMEESNNTDNVRVLERAVPATKPKGKGIVEKTASAGLSGLMLGLCIAFARAGIKSRVPTIDSNKL
jgi:capsular polysaccharide biosynthesis protein